MQEVVHGTDGVQNTKLLFDDPLDNGRAEHTDAIGWARARLNTPRELSYLEDLNTRLSLGASHPVDTASYTSSNVHYST